MVKIIIDTLDADTAIARPFAHIGIATGIASTRSPAAIESAARQLGAQLDAMTSQEAPSEKIMLVAVPLGTRATGETVTDTTDDEISPDALMGLLNAAR